MKAEFLKSLVRKMEQRAKEMDKAKCRSCEDRAVRRAMIVIYSELAAMIREELRKAIL